MPNRPLLEDVRLGLVDYFTPPGAPDRGMRPPQATGLLAHFTHDHATVFAYQSAFQLLARWRWLLAVGSGLLLENHFPRTRPAPIADEWGRPSLVFMAGRRSGWSMGLG